MFIEQLNLTSFRMKIRVMKMEVFFSEYIGRRLLNSGKEVVLPNSTRIGGSNDPEDEEISANVIECNKVNNTNTSIVRTWNKTYTIINSKVTRERDFSKYTDFPKCNFLNFFFFLMKIYLII